MVVLDEPGLSRRFAFAKGGCSGLGTSSKKLLCRQLGGFKVGKTIQHKRVGLSGHSEID
jgi:hypothetical protein